MRKNVFIAFLCVLFLSACQQEEWFTSEELKDNQVVFKLQCAEFEDENGLNRNGLERNVPYDRVEFCVADKQGYAVTSIKGVYDAASSELRFEGLQKGEYTLSIIGIKGDAQADGVTINPVAHISEPWLVFPSSLSKPLEADYFYSQTPFSVSKEWGKDGYETVVSAPSRIVQKHIVGRVDFSFDFNNRYIRTAVIGKKVQIGKVRFYTTFSAEGSFSGESKEIFLDTLGIETSSRSFHFPPTAGSSLQGEIDVFTRNYRGNEVKCTYVFDTGEIIPNRIHAVVTHVVHPDDDAGIMFITRNAYGEGNHARILQDGEPKEIYTDASQRGFNTAQPLQVSATDDGRLHVRFYSPRPLSGVLVKARIPSVGNEYVDLAYFDSIPSFADFYETMPLMEKDGMYHTESGRWIQIPKQDVTSGANLTFKIESDDAYWKKLQAIKHGWNISFELYGGNPDAADGGPVGNWMGIRPVHCREVVALFLNFTYMIDMQEHEEILRANEDRLYGNGGVNDKVTAETVLRQMRQPRTLRVGLVYPGNGVVGLGGGSTFGAYQPAWMQHYFDTYSCEVMFHELGHVMGYNHSSSFTYGPWAQELMNHFYVEHISEMPIDKPDYLNTKENPYLY